MRDLFREYFGNFSEFGAVPARTSFDDRRDKMRHSWLDDLELSLVHFGVVITSRGYERRTGGHNCSGRRCHVRRSARRSALRKRRDVQASLFIGACWAAASLTCGDIVLPFSAFRR